MPDRPLVRVAKWDGGRPVHLELTDVGEALVDRAIPLVATAGIEVVAKGFHLSAHQLQILMKLRALSQAGQVADVVVTEDDTEEPHG